MSDGSSEILAVPLFCAFFPLPHDQAYISNNTITTRSWMIIWITTKLVDIFLCQNYITHNVALSHVFWHREQGRKHPPPYYKPINAFTHCIYRVLLICKRYLKKTCRFFFNGALSQWIILRQQWVDNETRPGNRKFSTNLLMQPSIFMI